MTEPKNRYDLLLMTIDELVTLARQKKSWKLPFKENLVDYLVEVLGVSEEKALFESLCGNYGLKPTDWNRPFVQGRTTLRITGFVPHKPKNKFKLTSDTGKKFHCGESFILQYLGTKKKGKQISLNDYMND